MKSRESQNLHWIYFHADCWSMPLAPNRHRHPFSLNVRTAWCISHPRHDLTSAFLLVRICFVNNSVLVFSFKDSLFCTSHIALWNLAVLWLAREYTDKLIVISSKWKKFSKREDITFDCRVCLLSGLSSAALDVWHLQHSNSSARFSSFSIRCSGESAWSQRGRATSGSCVQKDVEAHEKAVSQLRAQSRLRVERMVVRVRAASFLRCGIH